MKSLLFLILASTNLFYSTNSQPETVVIEHPVRLYVEHNSRSINAAFWGYVVSHFHRQDQSAVKNFLIGFTAAYVALSILDISLAGLYFVLDLPFTLADQKELLAPYPILARTLFWGLIVGHFINRNKHIYLTSLLRLAQLRPLLTHPEQQIIAFLINPSNLVSDILVLGPTIVFFQLGVLHTCATLAHLPAHMLHRLFYYL